MTVTFTDDLAGVDWDALVERLVADEFSNRRTPDELRRSFEACPVRALALGPDADVVGTARALSDGIGNAYVVDVWTYTPYRDRGVGSTLVRRLLEQLSGQHVALFTDDRAGFYERLGFREERVGMSLVVGNWLNRYPPRPGDGTST